MSSQVGDIWTQLGVLFRTVQPTTEWIAFSARTDALLDPDTPLRNPETISYPGKDDPSVIPVHQGILERKSRSVPIHPLMRSQRFKQPATGSPSRTRRATTSSPRPATCTSSARRT